ncbi:MAG: efflux RND transporter periplasmic adaptor subunit [Aliidongia sp.]
MHDTPPPGTPISHRSSALPRPVQWSIVGAAAVAAVLALVLLPALSGLASSKPTAPPAAAEPPGTFRPTKDQLAGFKTAPVASQLFRTEQVTDGNIAIDDDRTTPVFSPYSGRVTKLIAKPGDVVKQGQPLFAIEASEFVQAQNDLIAAAAAVSTAKAQSQLTSAAEKRQHALFDSQAAARKDWEQSQADLAAAQAGLRSAEIALAAVHNRLRILGKSDKEIAALEAAGNVNAESVVVSPIAGTVIARKVGLGQYIQTGASDPVYSIGDLSTVWLIANVREADVALVKTGEPVAVHVLAYPDKIFRAKLSWVAPSVDPNTRRIPVRAEVENEGGVLIPEMFATFSIKTGEDVTAPGIPQSAIIYEGDKAHVWVLRDDALMALREIQAGRVQDGIVEVKSGLEPGEKIVTSGSLFIDRAADGS